MLSQLTIQNFGLIDRVSLEFNERLNILTGETGAGKSILIDALRIALGDRISPSQIREPQHPCVIEAVFDLSSSELKKSETLADYLDQDDPSLIIQRSVTADGKNKIKINGTAVTVGQLKDIGNYLVDFHGAHDHQQLLASESHSGMLDRLVDGSTRFACSPLKRDSAANHPEQVSPKGERVEGIRNFNEELDEYQKFFKQYAAVQAQLEDLQSLAQSRDREIDMITHQVKELEQVPLDEAQYAESLQEQTKIDNAERLSACISQLIEALKGEDAGASDKIRRAFGHMRTLNQIDEATSPWMEQLTQIQELQEDILKKIHDYADSLSFDADEAREIAQRSDIYDDIKRKYGPSLEDARRFYQEVKNKHDLLANLEHNDQELRKQLEALNRKVKVAAQKITERRKKSAAALKKVIEKELSELGMPHIRFECRIEPADFSHTGQDRVTFYISPNAGEEMKPLADIVSSGEAARVMLALKKALIRVDPVPVLIFDEIDAQIGGRLGTVTGEKLRDISKNRQVILITHLPQIASFADNHFKVVKIVKNNRALTQVSLLEKDERIQELAKMMSGEKESRIAVKHAHDMLAQARK